MADTCDTAPELGISPAKVQRLRRLKWVAILAPIPFIFLLEWARYLLYPHLLSWPGRLLMDGVVLAGMLFFYGAVFAFVSRMQERLNRQNRELVALQQAAQDIYGELSLDTLLQKVVDQSRQLLEARYGAISVIDEQARIREFLTSGISAEERARIGPPPQGHGILAIPLREGQRLRIPEVADHPRSAGFPPHHPPMHALLAVPIVCKGPFRGNLYVAEKETAVDFSEDDEETLVRFATEAAIAIDNAHLHDRLRTLAVAEERVRIAREMHDGMAQVLAYVNTKAQAVKEFLRQGRTEEAAAQLEQLAAAAREVYSDVREGILALRTPMGPDRSLAEALRGFLERWEEQSGISSELRMDRDVCLPPGHELQLLRIVQEALSNIRKHSGAASAWVELRRADRELRVRVEDDGSGFDPHARTGSGLPRFGMAIMRERAQAIGGSLRIESAPGRGTRVSIEIPLTSENP